MKFELYQSGIQSGILKFSASWCLPCRALGTTLRSMEDFNQTVYEVDVDLEPELAGQWNILSVPTLIMIQGGQPVNRASGNLSRTQIANFIVKGLTQNAE
jgi:thioredoxin-like negative regulator of GroEL